MPRWKQRFVCLACAHSAWREVLTEALEPRPNVERLEAGGFYCGMCSARRYKVVQVELVAGRWSDAFQPGGMRVGLMTFELSAGRDLELREARLRGR